MLEAEHERGRLQPRDRQPRVAAPWDFDRARPNASYEHDDRQQRALRPSRGPTDGQPGAEPVPPDQRDARLHVPVDERVVDDATATRAPYGAAFVGQSFDVSAAVTNLFTMHNRMHDWSYLLGFTEDNWNAQSSQLRPDRGLPRERPGPRRHAGRGAPPPGVYASVHNANMATLPDGSPSITNMYLWQPVAGAFYPPCVDGDYDAGIIGHEYTHMIENRMIGKGDQPRRLPGRRDGRGRRRPVRDRDAQRVRPRADRRTRTAARRARTPPATSSAASATTPANFPQTGAFPTPSTYPQVDPLNFSDIGYDVTGPEVHADGEIWIAINFELQARPGGEVQRPVPGVRPGAADALRGRRAAGQPVPGQPALDPAPVRLVPARSDRPVDGEARNSILAADQMRFGGANQNEICGRVRPPRPRRLRVVDDTAPAASAASRATRNPLPDFEVPGAANNATVKFVAVSRRRREPAVKARVFVGHYEARVSPIADTDPATNAPARLDARTTSTTTAVLRAGHVRVRRDGPGLSARSASGGRSGPARTRRSPCTWRPTGRRRAGRRRRPATPPP